MKPFHEWKEEQIASHTRENNGVKTFKEREWYWKEYGKYCTKMRKQSK